MKYYFDTSSLVKIYHREKGTPDVLEIYNNSENLIQISELGRIEFLSTVHRKYREKELTTGTLNTLIKKFLDDTDFRYETLQFSSLVSDEAEMMIQNLATQHALKMLDSIQFAFYKVYCESETVFVCSDVKLANLVKEEGFNILVM